MKVALSDGASTDRLPSYDGSNEVGDLMRFISSLEQHPEIRKQRFPEHLWPRCQNPKEENECWIFLEFTSAANLRPSARPIKQQPPMPDLECIVQVERRLFELGEILQSELAEGVAYSGKQAERKALMLLQGEIAAASSIQTAGWRSFRANASLERILRRKLAKTYETKGLPTDLVLFYDQQSPWGPFEYLAQWHDELACLVQQSVFQKVWIFYLPTAAIIGYLEPADNGTLRTVFDWQFHFDLKASFDALVPGCGEKPDEIKRFVPVLTSTKAGGSGKR